MFRISSKTHGLLDYVVGAAIAALPPMIQCGPGARAALYAAGFGAGVYSLLTDYERGVVKILPMETHLTLDVLSGAGLMAAAAMLDDERPQTRALLAGIGAFEIAVASVSSTQAYVDDHAPNVVERAAEPAREYV